jgi:pimeloyl-ACP methyl ester carboxylesterase
MREMTFETSDGVLAGSLYPGPGPAAVMVAGSGPADRRSLQPWVDAAVEVGLTVLVYDKPGCGGSSGDWRRQDFDGRAEETLAALATLRRQPEISGKPVAVIGGSQGAWIAMLAARSGRVDAVVCFSAAGVTVADQELYRIEHQLPTLGFDAADVESARAFLARRISRLAAGEDWGQVFADEQGFTSSPWRSAVGESDRDNFDFDARIYGFDPQPIIRTLTGPVLAVWGAEDVLVPVRASLDVFAQQLPDQEPQSMLITVPHADHGVRVTSPSGTKQFPPGLWKMVSTWLTQQVANT